jgi:Protein of unknown function (DUF1153)
MTSPRLAYMASHARSETPTRAAFVSIGPRKFVLGPDGENLTLRDLPDPGAEKWGMHMKAQVVFAVEGGLLSQTEACVQYAMSYEEYAGWKRCAQRKYHRSDWVRITPA